MDMTCERLIPLSHRKKQQKNNFLRRTPQSLLEIASIIKVCRLPIEEVNSAPPAPTVGQEAVELICQSERKTQKNAKISLWPLFSTEMDLILM